MNATPQVVTAEIDGGFVRDFDTLNASDKSSTVTLSNGDLTWTTAGKNDGVRSTRTLSGGSVYVEYTAGAGDTGTSAVGVATTTASIDDSPGAGDQFVYEQGGDFVTSGGSTASGDTWTAADVIGIAYSNGYVWFYKNGVFQSVAGGGFSSDARSGAAFIIDQAAVDAGIRFYVGTGDGAGGGGTWNFGETPFAYTPPSGFVGSFQLTAGSTRYMATSGFASGASDTPANTVFDPRAKGTIEYRRAVTCVVWDRSGVDASIGFIDFDNTDGALDEWLTETWRDRGVVLKRGLATAEYDEFALVARAVVDRISSPDWHTIRLTLRDKGALLDVPLQQSRYGELTFAPSLQDTPRPVLIGDCEGVPLLCVDTALLNYDIHDGTFEGVDQVTDQGVVLSEGGQWQIATTPGVYGIKRLTNPAGKQVCQARGAISGSVLIERLRDVVNYALDRSDVIETTEVDPYSVDSLDTDTAYTYCYYGRDNTTVGQFLTQLLDSCCGWWYFDRLGLLRVDRLKDPTGTATVELSDVNLIGDIRVSLDEARGLSDSIGCVRNWSPHNDTDIAGSVMAGGSSELIRAERLKAPQRVRKGAATLHQSYGHAVGAEPIPTLLSNETNGQQEADRITALYQDERYFYTCAAALEGALAYELEPGDIVSLESDRFGLTTAKNLLVISVTTNLLSSVVQLVLWGAGPRASDF